MLYCSISSLSNDLDVMIDPVASKMGISNASSTPFVCKTSMTYGIFQNCICLDIYCLHRKCTKFLYPAGGHEFIIISTNGLLTNYHKYQMVE